MEEIFLSAEENAWKTLFISELKRVSFARKTMMFSIEETVLQRENCLFRAMNKPLQNSMLFLQLARAKGQMLC
jgi:hypothetical protein